MELFFSKSPPPLIIKFSIYFLVMTRVIFIPHYAFSLTFNLTNISPQNQNRDIIPQGDASISSDGIQVTPDGRDSKWDGRAGRAIYNKPLHLWRKASGELASFTTSFTFVIDSHNDTFHGDGLVFFLAQNNSVITAGGAMGLPLNATTLVTVSPFVTVEFDTFWNNGWDPRNSTNGSIGDHVGININNLTSLTFRKWHSNVTYGGECQASITYDSVTKNFSAAFTDFQDNDNGQQVGLSYTIDLRNVLPEWVIFGFAAATGAALEQHTVKSWTFNSSNLQSDDGDKGIPQWGRGLIIAGVCFLVACLVGIALWKKKKKNKKKVREYAGYAWGLIAGLCGLVTRFIALVMSRKKENRGDAGEESAFHVKMSRDFENGTWPKAFPYDELAESTDQFSEEKKLGEGGFGAVYRGLLKDSNTYVAVKRVTKSSEQGIRGYKSEVMTVGQLRHRNLVKLIGWCHEKRELLLVYEFMENGSLDLHLFRETSSLALGVRYKIAQGLASALLYLHEGWEQCVLHRDIKSSNVMLDSNHETKLGDFGLAKLVDHEKSAHPTTPAGTVGYMALEYYTSGKATKESDVYSFGVVALEIACGRRAILHITAETQIRLVEWVWEFYGTGKLLQAADPRLGTDLEDEKIKHMMIVGLWCAHPDSEHRPSMRQAIQVLNFEAPLPRLPLKMPVPKYIAPLPFSISTILESIQN